MQFCHVSAPGLQHQVFDFVHLSDIEPGDVGV